MYHFIIYTFYNTIGKPHHLVTYYVYSRNEKNQTLSISIFEEKIFREITVSFIFLLVVFTQNILMGTFYDLLIF